MKQPDVIAGAQCNDVLINARSSVLEKETVTRLVRKYTPLRLFAFYRLLNVTIRFYPLSLKIITKPFPETQISIFIKDKYKLKISRNFVESVLLVCEQSDRNGVC